MADAPSVLQVDSQDEARVMDFSFPCPGSTTVTFTEGLWRDDCATTRFLRMHGTDPTDSGSRMNLGGSMRDADSRSTMLLLWILMRKWGTWQRSALTVVLEALDAAFEVAGPALGVSRDLPLPLPSSKGRPVVA